MRKFEAERIRPFRLVKYFSFSSLILIFFGIVILSFFNAHWAKRIQINKNKDYALSLVENLNHQIFLQFIIPVALKYGKIQLREKEQFERMDKLVRSTLYTFKVDRVNIYDMNNVISYSFEPDLVGKENMGGVGYRNALNGKSTSQLYETGSFFEILIGNPVKSKLIMFAPLRAEKPLSNMSGPILGVVEIILDMTEDYMAHFRFQLRTILTCTVVLGILFFISVLVVKRGEKIITQRNLEELELRQKLNRAEHLSSLGEMVAGISHEIRNPLGIIRSSAELLKKKMTAVAPSNTIPDIIVEEANRLNRIITDFLDYAKPRKLHILPCNILEIIQKNISYLSSQLDEQGYVIALSSDDRLPDIQADHEMLYQAFLNIFINAMQAMPRGGCVQVEVYLRGDDIIVRITDEGEGIPSEVIEKIWDPFFTTKENGTGLGLGIVKNIIESHNGRLEISNVSGAGACVKIMIPIIQGENRGNDTHR